VKDGYHPESCPSVEEIAVILETGLGQANQRAAIVLENHLVEWLSSCITCRQRLETLQRWQEEVGHPNPVIVARERNRARELWRELEDLPAERLPEELEERHFFWGMCSLLVERSKDAVAYSPSRSVTLAHAAVTLTVFLDPEYYSAPLLADLRARAWAYLGNAQRVAGDLEAADKSLRDALVFAGRGTGAALTRATVADLLGSLRVDQRRLMEAVQSLQQAADLYDRAGRSDLVGKVQLLLGNVAGIRDDVSSAILHLTRAQQLLDEDQHRFLFAHCQHSLVLFLIKAQHYEEAELRIPRLQSLWSELGHYRHLMKLRWAEGHIHLGKGQLETALKIFYEVSSNFQNEQNLYDLALVQLDIAQVLVRLGRFRDLATVAEKAYAVLASRSVHQEALRALQYVQEAAECETATAGMIQAVIDLFSKLQTSSQSKLTYPFT
jgi:tetratricopeptide (TPR) repeat protein